MKIAVCLSGQPRSIEYCVPALLNYFGNKGQHTFDFFCHAWDYNTWKILKADVSHEKLQPVDQTWLSEQIERLNPIHYNIEPRSVIYDNISYRRIVWSSLFYSAMMANHYKKQYENEHNFRYDCVVRGRFDIIFHPGRYFQPLEIMDRTLYHPHLERAVREHHFLNASDPFFYGDNWAMDIVSDVFRNIERDRVNIQRMDNAGILGPGALMSKYCRERNIQHLVDKDNNWTEVIYRKEMLGKDPVLDFEEIKKNHLSYYGL